MSSRRIISFLKTHYLQLRSTKDADIKLHEKSAWGGPEPLLKLGIISVFEKQIRSLFLKRVHPRVYLLKPYNRFLSYASFFPLLSFPWWLKIKLKNLQ